MIFCFNSLFDSVNSASALAFVLVTIWIYMILVVAYLHIS